MNPHYQDIFNWFAQNMEVAKTELHYRDPFQLLVATILSAQCTDKRVNLTTPDLFARFPSAAAMAVATVHEIYAIIKSVSYPNNKAKHLSGMAKMLIHKFNGIVPEDVEELQRLPGVGRKTANVVASVIYNKEVIAVDTHVFRVSHRLGFSKGKTPLLVERDLMQMIPPHLLPTAHHWLILHGRYICKAKTPYCSQCGVAAWCPKKIS
ncbi:MAG: endonuclease III [Prevotellaceae bacterium]|nr:endonuclease III [Prevotellaceae bacterium]